MYKNKNRKTTLIMVLVILLILAIGYIAFQSYQQKQLTAFQQGAQYGYQQAVIRVMQQATTCQQIPLTVEDKTLNIIAVECLKVKKY